jgi:hypothetical protein
MSIFSDVAQIRRDLEAVKARQAADFAAIRLLLINLGSDAGEAVALLEDIAEIAAKLDPTAVGIVAVPKSPHPRESHMANMTCTVEKKSGMKAGAPAAKAKAGDPPPSSLVLFDTEDGKFTIFGRNKAGTKLDISAVATLGDVTSDNPAVLTVDPPQGMTDQTHGVAAGTATVSVTATWNDGSVGPYTLTIPATVSTDPKVTGLLVEFDTPTVRA